MKNMLLFFGRLAENPSHPLFATVSRQVKRVVIPAEAGIRA
jgi:hypothetical protein